MAEGSDFGSVSAGLKDRSDNAPTALNHDDAGVGEKPASSMMTYMLVAGMLVMGVIGVMAKKALGGSKRSGGAGA
eukprot:CAMPEP_0205944566 /NCGR_PEP_ID=MMETSP1325-20131115/63583_1 /ASSEMBLY_ACC=CAM_ASM_000708 /TAXON_ID=236786 /ORGANISM="Florenciella sp., Strain RCC1007" /LENGTH=74 /DNA_ID=CAMNT_0053315475 /DNA_START=19 /DNA_END=240 /DNA_ORIENTATION=-